jgi:hypothetical protein
MTIPVRDATLNEPLDRTVWGKVESTIESDFQLACTAMTLPFALIATADARAKTTKRIAAW